MPDTTVSAQPVVDAQLDLAGRCFADELPKLLEGRLCDLQLLDVADNSLGDAGVSALVAALCQPGCGAQLRFLGLAKNSIGDDGGCAIAGWLQLGGGALQHLELRDNGLADRAAAALAAVLRGPSALEHLSLFHNSVGRRGAPPPTRCAPTARSARSTSASISSTSESCRRSAGRQRRRRSQRERAAVTGGAAGGIAGGIAVAPPAAAPAAASPIRRASRIPPPSLRPGGSLALTAAEALLQAVQVEDAAADASAAGASPPLSRAEALLGAARAVFDRERSGGTGGAALEVLNPVAAAYTSPRGGAAAPAAAPPLHVHVHNHAPPAPTQAARR